MFSKVLDFEEFPKAAAMVVILFNELAAKFLTGLALLDFSSSLFLIVKLLIRVTFGSLLMLGFRFRSSAFSEVSDFSTTVCRLSG